MTPEQIRLARNEIYARHGRRFKDNTLQVYFQSKTWYEVTSVCIFGKSYYDISVMDNKTAGDTLLLNNSVYRIMSVDIEDLGDGEDVYLEYVSGDDLKLIHRD